MTAVLDHFRAKSRSERIFNLPDRVPTEAEAKAGLRADFVSAVVESPHCRVWIPPIPAPGEQWSRMTITDLLLDRLGGDGAEQRCAELVEHIGRLYETDAGVRAWVDREAESFAAWHAGDAVIAAQENAS